jgi:hypothetical protein
MPLTSNKLTEQQAHWLVIAQSILSTIDYEYALMDAGFL